MSERERLDLLTEAVKGLWLAGGKLYEHTKDDPAAAAAVAEWRNACTTYLDPLDEERAPLAGTPSATRSHRSLRVVAEPKEEL